MPDDPRTELARLEVRKASLEAALERIGRSAQPDLRRAAWVQKEIAAVEDAIRRIREGEGP